jgi:hypothetical protein
VAYPEHYSGILPGATDQIHWGQLVPKPRFDQIISQI